MDRPKWKRVMLKLSGEAFAGKKGFGLDLEEIDRIAEEIKEVWEKGVEISIITGGGNIVRGVEVEAMGMDRATGDYMGMLATVINALALQDALEKKGVPTRVQTAIEMREVAEPFIRRRAIAHMERGRVVIFAAGTGNPFLSTDTAAALRAAEVKAEVLLKATNVDGVYEEDPRLKPDARLFKKLDYLEMVKRGLRIMDYTAVMMSQQVNIPIVVFNMRVKGNITKAALGEDIGTFVGGIVYEEDRGDREAVRREDEESP
jgi:uridylate kinase